MRKKKLKNHRNISNPAHFELSQKSLSSEQSKVVEWNPDTACQMDNINSCPSYRQADEDVDFLHRDEMRGLRLQLDYQKPEMLLEQHDIAHTIVVFGSTRILESEPAKKAVVELRKKLAVTPGDTELKKSLAVAERILAKSPYYTVAQEFGRLVGEANKERLSSKLVIMTGGGPGIMEAANRGACDVGEKSIGLNIALPHEQFPNPYITPELCFRFHYFALRKLHFLLRARALVVFPGGYGTLDELFEVLTLVQTRKISPLPIVLVGRTYWERVLDVDFLVEEGVIDQEDKELFWFAESASDIWESILKWYCLSGEPLIGEGDHEKLR